MSLPFAGCKVIEQLFFHPDLGVFVVVDDNIICISSRTGNSIVPIIETVTYDSAGTKSHTCEHSVVAVNMGTRMAIDVTHVTGGVEFDVIEDDLVEGSTTAMIVSVRQVTLDDIKVS